MKRVDPVTEQRVVTLIALGYAYADISDKTGVAVPTIKKIRRRSQERLDKVEERVIEKHVDEVTAILQKSYREINHVLDNSERGLIELSIKDLLTISNELHRQTVANSPQAPRPQNLELVYKKYL